MAQPIPSYRELYSISDLHLGGPFPRVQMFCQGERLKDFIVRLAAKPSGLALVLNGDVIDSLPYLTTSGSYIALDGAAAIMRTIMTDDSFKSVFAGLKTFLESEGHELIILTGNHDLELALPEAQEQLLTEVAPTASARGRVRFVTNGTGFRCRVGDLNVYITHGNEADFWNHVDHEALRKAAHARTLGQSFDTSSWVPNAGTKLVVDVMNRIKEQHPFVDLLKPETKAALKVLTVLDPKTIKDFFDALPAFAKAARAYAGPHVVLGDGGRPVVAEPEVVRLLNEASTEVLQSNGRADGGLMDRVGQLQKEGKSPEDLVRDDDATLSTWGYLWDVVTGTTPVEALRSALENWVKDDRSFDLQDRDEVFTGVFSQIGRNVDVVITGHTHLPRWIVARERGDMAYLNAGTWARLIGLKKEFFLDEKAFEPVYRALMSRDITTLDAANVAVNGGAALPLLLDATAAARVGMRDGRNVAELVRITYRNQQIKEEVVDPSASVLTWL